ncbi:MAG TPA: ThuA domain-containing protein [Verrucomicrobiae bacterium]|nr:ThuA domain-containing protein [Verrucomicrobiae bacterium]
MKPAIPIALLFCALLPFGMPRLVAAESNDIVRVLFLGDRAGHRPAQRFEQLQPALAPRGIELTYTEAMSNLNAPYLSQFDALLIYANVTRISPDQEKAMLDFVAAGGGLVPIHCASYCFHNSSNYIALVGAQFRRHTTGVFKETIINADHPVMKGLSPIESWDETYVHHRHNTNRVVLAERRYSGTNSMAANLGNTDPSDGAEPWTWVREYGKGRVFYTAWGHDQRTWSNPGFQALVESGIRWAAENSPNRSQRKSAK